MDAGTGLTDRADRIREMAALGAGNPADWALLIVVALERIAAALEAANRADLLAMIAEALGEGETAQAGAEGAEGPTESFPGVLAVYRHPAGDPYRIVARRQAGVPGGWAVSVEGSGG